MAGILTRAKERATDTAPDAKSATTWTLPADLEPVLAEFITLHQDADLIDGRIKLQAAKLKAFAETQFVAGCLEAAARLPAPMAIANEGGDTAAFVVQDCTRSTPLNEGQIKLLGELLGSAKVSALLEESTSFALNQKILALPGVAREVEKALTAAAKKLVKSKTLTADQAEDLIEAEKATTLIPGTFEKLCADSRMSTIKLSEFLRIIGSAIKRFIKV